MERQGGRRQLGTVSSAGRHGPPCGKSIVSFWSLALLMHLLRLSRTEILSFARDCMQNAERGPCVAAAGEKSGEKKP